MKIYKLKDERWRLTNESLNGNALNDC